MNDPHDLTRYVAAQQPVFERVCAELAAGRKQTHWMWYVFPQLRGLGSSPTAERYGIGSLEEARAYLAHPRSASGCAVAHSWSTLCKAAAPRRSSAIRTI